VPKKSAARRKASFTPVSVGQVGLGAGGEVGIEVDGGIVGGHAWFETYSVLTRLPPGARRSPGDVLILLEHDFPATRFLDEPTAAGLRRDLARLGIAGGAVYDALVAAAAVHHGLKLLSRDRRALAVYEALGADVTLVS